MSESAPTLSQPTSPTAGLQSYDLAGSARHRRLLHLFERTKGARSRRIGRPRAAAMQKGLVMSKLPQMLETLEKSVVAISSSDPAGQAALVTQTFGEFRELFEPELEKAVGDAANSVIEQHAAENPEAFEQPLYKGLGTVGRVANLVGMMASAIKRIDEGKDYSSDNDNDPATDDVMALLEHALAAAELALRASVNEHVELADDDEEPDPDLNYVTVPNADGGDDAALVLKTALPTDLAKYASDPANISLAAIELASGMMLEAGVGEDALNKMFAPEGEALAKFGGADPAATDPSANPAATDPGSDPAAGGGDPNDLVSQIEIAGRLAAAQLMQIDHIMQIMGNQGAGGDDVVDPDADPAADPDADQTDPGEMPAATDAVPPKKTPAVAKAADDADDNELAKLVGELLAKTAGPSPELIEMRKHVGDLESRLEVLGKTPAAPKAVLAGAPALTKAADSGAGDGGGDVLEKLAAEVHACKTEEQRNHVLLKASFKGVDVTALRKLA